mmetsp:Transcript_19448/g.36621  ORF Transcript_19448/g.36621 Transcript_19448/m.36621 type:complete len:148 (+) Transcript_19448:313-756(+)
MKNYDLEIEIHKVSRIINVKNSMYIRNIYLLIKGRDFLRLIVRSVPLSIAKKIFDDNITYCILKINLFFKKKKRYDKRNIYKWKKEYLIIKVLEFISGCNIITRGNSICIIGGQESINILLNMINKSNKKLNYLKLLQLFIKINNNR